MFIGFTKSAPKTSRNKKSIEQKRTVVVRSIDDWLSALATENYKGVVRLSERKNGVLQIWLKYANRNVPLNERGDDIGLIDISKDEQKVFRDLRNDVLLGKYDDGIEKIAKSFHDNMTKAKIAKN